MMISSSPSITTSPAVVRPYYPSQVVSAPGVIRHVPAVSSYHHSSSGYLPSVTDISPFARRSGSIVHRDSATYSRTLSPVVLRGVSPTNGLTTSVYPTGYRTIGGVSRQYGPLPASTLINKRISSPTRYLGANSFTSQYESRLTRPFVSSSLTKQIGISPPKTTGQQVEYVQKTDYYRPGEARELAPGSTDGLEATYDAYKVRTFRTDNDDFGGRKGDLSVLDLSQIATSLRKKGIIPEVSNQASLSTTESSPEDDDDNAVDWDRSISSSSVSSLTDSEDMEQELSKKSRDVGRSQSPEESPKREREIIREVHYHHYHEPVRSLPQKEEPQIPEDDPVVIDSISSGVQSTSSSEDIDLNVRKGINKIRRKKEERHNRKANTITSRGRSVGLMDEDSPSSRRLDKRQKQSPRSSLKDKVESPKKSLHSPKRESGKSKSRRMSGKGKSGTGFKDKQFKNRSASPSSSAYNLSADSDDSDNSRNESGSGDEIRNRGGKGGKKQNRRRVYRGGSSAHDSLSRANNSRRSGSWNSSNEEEEESFEQTRKRSDNKDRSASKPVYETPFLHPYNVHARQYGLKGEDLYHPHRPKLIPNRRELTCCEC